MNHLSKIAFASSPWCVWHSLPAVYRGTIIPQPTSTSFTATSLTNDDSGLWRYIEPSFTAP